MIYNAIGVDEVIYAINVLEGGNPKFGQTILPGYFGCGIWRGNTFVRHYSSRSDPVWAADVLAWVNRAHQLLTTDTILAPHHLALIINHPADVLSADERYLLSRVNVDMDETGYSSYGTWTDPKQAYIFGMTLDWTRYAQQHGIRVITVDKFAFTPTISNEQVDYSLATYMMGNEGAEDLVVTGHHYDVQPYFSQYGISAGSACGAPYRDALSANIYSRRFVQGLTVVNSGTTAETAHLPAGHLYHDMLGRAVRNPLLVAGSDGYAMTTSSNGCR